MRVRSLPSAAMALALLLGCGGGGSSPKASQDPGPTPVASRLDYTDPTAGTWRLLKNTSRSTATHLVLDLVGPTGTSVSGVGFYLAADSAKVAWTKVDPADPELVRNQAFALAALVAKARVVGAELNVGVYQTGTVPAKAADQPLLQVALDLKPGLNLAPNTAISLAGPGAGKAKLLLPPGGPQTLADFSIAVGSLAAR